MKLRVVALAILAALSSVPALAAAETTVLVTGANRGIGLEYARQFAAKGYTVIGTARSPEKAEALAGVADRVEQLDVTDAARVAALVHASAGVPPQLVWIRPTGTPSTSRTSSRPK